LGVLEKIESKYPPRVVIHDYLDLGLNYQVKVNVDSFQVKKNLRSRSIVVFFMGGIALKNLETLGFDGLVLQSAIWKSDDYLNTFQDFLSMLLDEHNSESKMKIA